MAPTQPQWTEQEGFDYETAKGILWDQIGKRNAALHKLAQDDDVTRDRLRTERSAFFDLAMELHIHDARRVAAIRRFDFDEAFHDGSDASPGP